MRKNYVLDTSTIIHDPHSLQRLVGNNVIIPIYVVMELDSLKSRKGSSAAHAARTASRILSSIFEGDLKATTMSSYYNEDLDINYVYFLNDLDPSPLAHDNNNQQTMDSLIINSALRYKELNTEFDTILVSKDVNMRLIASFMGMNTENYKASKAKRRESDYTHVLDINDLDSDTLNKVYSAYTSETEIEFDFSVYPNEYVIIDKYMIRCIRDNVYVGVSKKNKVYGIKAKDKRQEIALDLLLDKDVKLVSMFGKSGTGKTFLALAAALEQIQEKKLYSKVILAKPVIPVGKDIGFLPGALEEKLAPWMESFFDNLDQLFGGDKNNRGREKVWKQLMSDETITMQALSFIRGRSIPDAIIILDEAQNVSPIEIKALITRAAENTKIVICGDIEQIDSEYLDKYSNGLSYASDRLKALSITGCVELIEGVRSELSEQASKLL